MHDLSNFADCCSYTSTEYERVFSNTALVKASCKLPGLPGLDYVFHMLLINMQAYVYALLSVRTCIRA